MTLRLLFLGKPNIIRDAETIKLPAPRPLALLTYLVLNQRPLTREHLADLLFDAPADPRAALRWTLTKLRRLIGSDYLLTNRQTITFNTEAPYFLDVAAFRSGETELYRGHLLEMVHLRDAPHFNDWLLFEREALAREYREQLETRLKHQQRAADFAAQVDTLQALLHLDNLREDWHRGLMTAYAGLNNRQAALAQFEQCQKLLHTEIGVAPSAETQGLANAIRKQAPISAPAEIPTTPIPLRSPSYSFRTPLFGRDDELTKLRHCWEDTQSNQGHIVMLKGEPGIGKTRLARELLSEIDGNALILHAKCPELKNPLAFTLFVNPLRELLAHTNGNDLPPEWLAEISRILPDIAAPVPPPQAAEPDVARRRMFDAICATLLSAAKERPLVLYLDDLQWTDATSLDMLQHFTAQIHHHPIMILGTFRHHTLSKNHPLHAALQHWLSFSDRFCTLALLPLPEHAVRKLFLTLTNATAESDTFSEQLFAETGGNPLFVRESIATLKDAGQLPDDLNSWESFNLKKFMPVPRIKTVIEARLNRLNEVSRDIIDAASILRRGFSFGRLQQLGEWDKWTLLNGIETLLSSGLLVEERGGRVNFSHDKIREVAHSQLSAVRRQFLHARVGEMLEETYRGREAHGAERLAFHFSEAGETEKACRYHQLAGETAETRFTHDEAVYHFTSALDLLNGMEFAAQRASILEQLGDIFNLLARHTDAAKAFSEASQTFKELSDGVAHARVLLKLGLVYHNLTDGKSSLAALRESEKIAQAAGEAAYPILVQSLANQAWSELMWPRNPKETRKLVEQALEITRKIAPPDYLAIGASLNAKGGYLKMVEFDMEGAIEHWKRAETAFQSVGQYQHVFQIRVNIASAFFEFGYAEEALAMIEETLPNVETYGDVYFLLAFQHIAAAAKLMMGQYAAAEKEFEQLVRSSDVSRYGDFHYALMEGLAMARLRRGKINQALQVAIEAYEGTRHYDTTGTAWLLRVLGMIAAQTGSPITIDGIALDSTICFLKSLHIFGQFNRPAHIAETLQLWGNVELTHGSTIFGETLWRQARAEFLRLNHAQKAANMDAEHPELAG